MTILVTGAAGFIGSFVCQSLLTNGQSVVGIDNLNDYYDVQLKQNRLRQFKDHQNFQFIQMDLTNQQGIQQLFQQYSFEKVVNLAAQAGVRYSLENPNSYIQSNIVGFTHILECCRHHPVKHLVYASSSSVYGNNTKVPFAETDRVDEPISLYAATKKSNELLAYSYSHLYRIPMTGLRFFTVYGPWGRPDMAYFKFAKAIMEEKAIDVYNQGNLRRDFTYIDDIVKGLVTVLDNPPPECTNDSRHSLYNIGNNKPVNLMDFIQTLENILDKKAILNMMPMQDGDVKQTYADIEQLRKIFAYAPHTPLQAGLKQFAQWFKPYYGYE